MKWEIVDNVARSQKGMTVTLPFSVLEAREWREYLLVVLNVPPSQDMTENVFGIHEMDGLIWQIEATTSTNVNPHNYYTGILWQKEYMCGLYNWNGVSLEVNMMTGGVSNPQFVK